MNYNPNNHYNPNLGNQVRYNQPVRKKSSFVKLVVLAVLVVVCYFGYKEVEKRFLLPIGTWKSADTPIEMKFLEDGELQMGAYGTYCTLSEYLSQSRFKMRLERNEWDKTGKAEITRDRANLTETILRVCDSNNEKNGQNFISVFEVMKNKRIIG